jgi:hypothetical protein
MSAEPPVEKKHFPTWKTIMLGTYKSVKELSEGITSKGFKIDSYGAAEILKKVTLAPAETEIELVRVTARELGFDRPTPRCEIYARAVELGLEVLPAEVGPQLRLQYLNQPPSYGEGIAIGMEPITDSGGYPRVFAVSGGQVPDTRYDDRDKDEWWLGANYATPSHTCHPDLHQWVFGRRKQN